jgi:electron transport complex protein RnfG
MAKLESSFKNMVISLVAISMVAAAALAGVYTLTKDTITEQKAEKEQSAILAVLPNNGVGAFVAPADTIDKKKDLIVYRAYSDSLFVESSYIGSAVKISANGFGGKFKIMVGFDAEENLVNYTVLEHQETPGLGDKMRFWFNDTTQTKRCITGRKATGKFQVSKGVDKATIDADPDNYVDAITAATISSKYFLGAINEAYAAVAKEEVEVHTSASEQVHPDSATEEYHQCKKNGEEHPCPEQCHNHNEMEVDHE